VAVKQAGYKLGKDIALALDVAALEFYVAEKKATSSRNQAPVLTGAQIVSFYRS